MAPPLPALIDISSSDDDKDEDSFENDVPPPSAYMKSSSPAIRVLPSKRPLPPISKFHSSTGPAPLHDLCSSSDDDDEDLPKGDAIFTRTTKTTTTTVISKSKSRDVSVGFGVASGSGLPPPSKKLKVSEPTKSKPSKSLSILDGILNDPSTWTDPGAPILPRRTLSAPSARPSAAAAFDLDDDDEIEIEQFTDGIRSEDMEMDVWEERQKQKERDRKGKGKEVAGGGGGDVFGTGGAVGAGAGKGKAPVKRRGKTDEEKAEALAETARKKAEKLAEKEEAKAAKAAEKLRLTLSKDVNKLRGSKTETFKELVVDISSSSHHNPAFSTLLPSFRDQVEARDSSISFFDSTLDVDPSNPNNEERPNANPNPTNNARPYTPPTILKFRRRLTARYSEVKKAWIPLHPSEGKVLLVPETTVVVYLTAHELVEHLRVDPTTRKRNTLLEFPSRVRNSLKLTSRATVVLIVQGIVALYRRKETMAKRDYQQRVREGMGQGGGAGGVRAKEGWEKELGKKEIEKELVRLQVSERCFVTYAEADEEVLAALISTIGDLALKPYRMIERNHLTFAPHNIKGKNLSDTFCKMLEHLPRVTPAVSGTIQETHGSWRRLMEEYDELEESRKEKEAKGVLSDLRVGRTKAGVPNERKVGVALSARIHTVLREEDGLILVGST
ncbi:hypothetical protein BDY24DRAFT_415982 [Mrakia frigida]|uniref:uncharacterized protein n=1 Tax=Mrakia frigida TaxID=29902 RepID=UPI003FCC0384